MYQNMREKIEEQLKFAKQKEQDAKYHESLRWEGYQQGLKFVLGSLDGFASSKDLSTTEHKDNV